MFLNKTKNMAVKLTERSLKSTFKMNSLFRINMGLFSSITN
jgi:hypothetical protein